MKALCIIVLLSTVAVYAGQPGNFASSGRIITIAQWKSPEGMVWAVQKDRIVVYRSFDYVFRDDELVVIKPLTPAQLTAIKDTIKKLPKDAFGYHHDAFLSTGAPLLRISFRGDGKLDRTGIEISGYFPAWIEDLVGAVSTASQPEAPITFQDTVLRYRKGILKDGDYVPPIQKIDLKRWYTEQDPNRPATISYAAVIIGIGVALLTVLVSGAVLTVIDLRVISSEMPEELGKREVVCKKGKAKFILVNSVLLWGLPMYILWTFFLNPALEHALSPPLVLIAAIIWALGGALFGWVMWTLSERKYQKYLAALKPE